MITINHKGIRKKRKLAGESNQFTLNMFVWKLSCNVIENILKWEWKFCVEFRRAI